MTGKHVEDEAELVRIVVREHPDLEDGPVEIEALAEELTGVEELALDLVTFELHHPDADGPETVVMEVSAFNRLASAAAMAEVLRGAQRVTGGTPGPARAAGAKERINYASPEHAGKPHKGRITEAEKQLVQEQLEEVNRRLSDQGIRTVDLANPDHVARYGLDALAQELGVVR
ncbi:hypothetical protein [Kitasatospora viridis]|uniref:hypothetical protein n=1 Tax=Kitasatospora viridis TaxID=281105 RepID=UPI0011A5B97E|nr:hypothetical protein [Kitasatospora viridis]